MRGVRWYDPPLLVFIGDLTRFYFSIRSSAPAIIVWSGWRLNGGSACLWFALRGSWIQLCWGFSNNLMRPIWSTACAPYLPLLIFIALSPSYSSTRSSTRPINAWSSSRMNRALGQVRSALWNLSLQLCSDFAVDLAFEAEPCASFWRCLTMFASYAILLGFSAAVAKTQIEILRLLQRFKRTCRASFFHFSYAFVKVKRQSRDKNPIYYTVFDLSCDADSNTINRGELGEK